MMLSPIMNEMNYIIKMLERIHPWFISTTTKVPLFGCLITFCLTENTRSSYRRAWHRVFLYAQTLSHYSNQRAFSVQGLETAGSRVVSNLTGDRSQFVTFRGSLSDFPVNHRYHPMRCKMLTSTNIVT